VVGDEYVWVVFGSVGYFLHVVEVIDFLRDATVLFQYETSLERTACTIIIPESIIYIPQFLAQI
jgi:hypothetical protein